MAEPRITIVEDDRPSSVVIKKKRLEDFDLGEVIGDGAFGAVFEATDKETNEKYAIKQLNKGHIQKTGKSKYVLSERDLMSRCQHPNIVQLFYTFQDKEHLYYVLEYAGHGELLTHIRKHGTMGLPVTAFYAAEIILALEYLHTNGIVHRDLKPENILLNDEWHVKITDFGEAKVIGTAPGARSGSFVGTAEYMSPELVNDRSSYLASDLWALGCIIYQMISGRPPFRGVTPYMTLEKIKKAKESLVFPQGFPTVAQDLISRLLVIDPTERLGAKNYADLKAHPFFYNTKFDNLANMTPPALAPLNHQLIWTEDVLKEEEERKQRLREEEKKRWEKFLFGDENIMTSGLVYKRRKLSIKLRQLILTDGPRLFYLDPKKMEFKGEIPWSLIQKVEIRTDIMWKVHTPKRIYHLEDVQKNSQRWEEEINKLKEKSRQKLASKEK
jgi:3-phosphoinositide dependent protein kinase-1